LKNLDPNDAKPLLYKKKQFDVYMYTVPTPTLIYFVFESRAKSRKIFDLVFQLKGLKLEDRSDNDSDKWLVDIDAGQKLVKIINRVEEKGGYSFKVKIKL